MVFFFQLQDLVGLVISMLLLGDFSLVLLTLLQMFSFSLADVFLVLFILPLGILLPFPAGINALFSQGPRRSAGLARIYALWNITSLVNVVSLPTSITWTFKSQPCLCLCSLLDNRIWWFFWTLFPSWLHFSVDMFTQNLNPRNIQAISHGLLTCERLLQCA